MSETKKDYVIEITVKVSERTRSTYSSETEIFKTQRAQTLMADSDSGIQAIKSEVLLNVKDTSKAVNRFFETKFN